MKKNTDDSQYYEAEKVCSSTRVFPPFLLSLSIFVVEMFIANQSMLCLKKAVFWKLHTPRTGSRALSEFLFLSTTQWLAYFLRGIFFLSVNMILLSTSASYRHINGPLLNTML
jgi:hypothetical protein